MVEDMESKRAAAMRLVGMTPPVEQREQVRDLSQMRPVIQQTVQQQELMARQILPATYGLFRDLIERSKDPTIKHDFRDSQLSTLLG